MKLIFYLNLIKIGEVYQSVYILYIKHIYHLIGVDFKYSQVLRNFENSIRIHISHVDPRIKGLLASVVVWPTDPVAKEVEKLRHGPLLRCCCLLRHYAVRSSAPHRSGVLTVTHRGAS
jgi:hypothetical protein